MEPLDRIHVAATVKLPTAAEPVRLFRALPSQVASVTLAKDSKCVTCSALEFANSLRTGDVVQPSTMTGVNVAVLAGRTLLMFGARLSPQSLPLEEALQNRRTTDVHQQFSKRDGTPLQHNWVPRVRMSLSEFVAQSVDTVVRVCVCLPGIAGDVPAELAPGMKPGCTQGPAEYIFVVTRENLSELFDADVLRAVEKVC